MSGTSVTRAFDDSGRQQLLESVIADYIRACDAGAAPDQRLILEQHPELADDLRDFFAQRDHLNQLAGPIRAFGDSLFQSIGPGKHISYVGDYELLEEVARGGMGVVYKARQKTLGRIVAVKMMLTGRLANEDDVKRFQIEAQAAASLQHPNIVPIHEVGQHEGLHYFSMDFVEGRSLASVLRENVLPPKSAANIVRVIAEAIHYAHQQGTLHRDLKPSNILMQGLGTRGWGLGNTNNAVASSLAPSPQPLTPKITDFGLAMRVEGDSGLTQTGQIVGTPSYMPPEQAQGKRSLIGPGSDVYSLGAILYECLTGRAPFRADSVMKTIEQVIHREAASPRLLNPGVARDLETICLKCLEKEPHRRYGTAQLLADDLGRFLRDEPIVARPTTLWERGVKWVRRHPTAAALVFVSAVAMLALVGVGVGRHYNARLETANTSLKSVNSRLETTNTRLETTSAELRTTLQAVQVEKTEAERQRALAKEAEAKAKRYFYAAQMQQVELARQQKQNDRVVQLLRSVIPDETDEEDPRGFEWHHLWRLYHCEQSHLRGHKGAVRAVAFGPDDRLLASAGDDTTIKLWDITTGKDSSDDCDESKSHVTTGKERFTLTGHTAHITGLSFSSSGKWLASCSADKTIKVWDIEAHRELLSLEGHEAAITSVAFSPDDQHIASGSEDQSVRIWNSVTGETVKTKSFADAVSGVSFNRDRKQTQLQVACVTRRENPTTPCILTIWQPFTETEVTLQGEKPGRSQRSVAVSPDGVFVASADDGVRASGGAPTTGDQSLLRPRVALWNVRQKGEPKSIGIHESNITQIVFSPDGQRLASASLDRTVKVWDFANHVADLTLNDEAGVYAIAFSPDGSRLASGGGDGTVKIWSMPARTLQTGVVHNVVFSPDGKHVAASGSTATIVWDAYSGRQILRLAHSGLLGDRPYFRAQWSPNGRFIACSPEGIWDATTGVAQTPLNNKPDGNRYRNFKVAFTTDSNLLATTDHVFIKTFNMTTKQLVNNFRLPDRGTCVAISPDNKLIAAGSGTDFRNMSGAVKLWHLESGADGVALEEAFFLSVWDVAFSPDGTRLAAAIGDYHERAVPGEVVVWDVQTGVALHRFRGHRSCVWAVAFSPDGKRLTSASGPWREARGAGKVEHGSRLISLSDQWKNTGSNGLGEVKMWDMATGQEVCTFPGHTGTVFGVAFSPCGRRLATGSADGTVKIWDGTPLAETPSRDGPAKAN